MTSHPFFSSKTQRRYRQLFSQLYDILKEERELRIEKLAYQLGVSTETVRRIYYAFADNVPEIQYSKGTFRFVEREEG